MTHPWAHSGRDADLDADAVEQLEQPFAVLGAEPTGVVVIPPDRRDPASAREA